MSKKVALITHATKYAGPGAVAALLQAGYVVMCHDTSFIDQDKKNNFETMFPGVLTSTNKTPGELVNYTVKHCGYIDLLVSNDVHPLQHFPVDETEITDIRETLEALMIWPFCLFAKVAAHMKLRKKGHIILITSAAPDHPEMGFSIYSSIRAGASAFAKAAARELAPHHIIVNAIAPNYLESETYYPADFWQTAAGQDKLRKAVPMGRLGKSEEIGNLIAFLASGGADFITGQVINFTGGWP